MVRRRIKGRAAALMVGLLAALPAGLEAAGPPAAASGYAAWVEEVLGTPPEEIELFPALEQRLAEQVRERRREEAVDLPPLEDDPRLADAARAHALDMLVRDYVDHTDPDGRSAHDRVGILHRRLVGTTAENLAEHTGLTRGQRPSSFSANWAVKAALHLDILVGPTLAAPTITYGDRLRPPTWQGASAGSR